MAANNDTNLAQSASTKQKQRSRMSVMSRSFSVFALLASALFAAAFVTAQENTPDASSTPAATPSATPSAEMPRLELNLEELNDSGIEGTVTLYDAGASTIVEFDVEGAGGDHPANISAGVCGDLDPEPLHELEPVDENGESLTVVDSALDELLESEHAIDMRLAPDQLGTLIACVNIEGEPEIPAEGTPVSTPQSTPQEAPEDATGGQVTETPDPVETPAETPEATVAPTATEAASTPETDGTGGAINGETSTTTITLRELNDSGVTGTASLTEQGNATAISIILEGNGLTGGHIAHLHSGTCDDPGDYTFTLNPVDADGTSETVVNLTPEELLTEGYMINIHPSEENWDAWMVCGELTTGSTTEVTPTQVAPTPTTAPSAGGPTDATTTPAATTPPTTVATEAPQATTVTTPAVVGGDGTAGVTGTVSDGSVSTLPQQAGVGAMLDWPSDPRTAILWASTGAAIILAAAAFVIRRGERHQTANPSRWTRLGI